MKGKVRRFRITGLDEGYPIESYIVETDYRGDIDHHLNCCGDCARYYEELNGYEEELNEREIFDLIIEQGIATEEELDLIIGINGFSIETLNDVICFKTGYHDIQQYLEREGEKKNDKR